MGFTGKKIYQTLEEYYLDTNQPTGNTKPNVLGDPDYIEPVIDLVACPISFFTATRSQNFYSTICTPPLSPQPILFTKSYTSQISQSDAQSKADNDVNFVTEGQAYANANGTCNLDTAILQVYLVKEFDIVGDGYKLGASINRWLTMPVTVNVNLIYQTPLLVNETKSGIITLPSGSYSTIAPSIFLEEVEGTPIGMTLISSVPVPNSTVQEYSSDPVRYLNLVVDVSVEAVQII